MQIKKYLWNKPVKVALIILVFLAGAILWQVVVDCWAGYRERLIQGAAQSVIAQIVQSVKANGKIEIDQGKDGKFVLGEYKNCPPCPETKK